MLLAVLLAHLARPNGCTRAHSIQASICNQMARAVPRARPRIHQPQLPTLQQTFPPMLPPYSTAFRHPGSYVSLPRHVSIFSFLMQTGPFKLHPCNPFLNQLGRDPLFLFFSFVFHQPTCLAPPAQLQQLMLRVVLTRTNLEPTCQLASTGVRRRVWSFPTRPLTPHSHRRGAAL